MRSRLRRCERHRRRCAEGLYGNCLRGGRRGKWCRRRCAERLWRRSRFWSRRGKRHWCRCGYCKLRLFRNLSSKRLRFGSCKWLNLRLCRWSCKWLCRRVHRLSRQWRRAEGLTPGSACRCLRWGNRQRLHNRRLRRTFRFRRGGLRTTRCCAFVDAEVFREDFVDFAVINIEQCAGSTWSRRCSHRHRLLDNVAWSEGRRIDIQSGWRAAGGRLRRCAEGLRRLGHAVCLRLTVQLILCFDYRQIPTGSCNSLIARRSKRHCRWCRRCGRCRRHGCWSWSRRRCAPRIRCRLRGQLLAGRSRRCRSQLLSALLNRHIPARGWRRQFRSL